MKGAIIMSNEQQWAPGTVAVANNQGQFEVVKGRFSVSGYPIEHIGTSIKEEMMIDFSLGEFSVADANKEAVSFSADMAKEAFLQKIDHILLTDLMECEGELFELSSTGIRFPGKVEANKKLFEDEPLAVGNYKKFVLFLPTVNTPLDTNVTINVSNKVNTSNASFTMKLSEVYNNVIDLSSFAAGAPTVDDFVITSVSFAADTLFYSNPVLLITK